MRSLWCMTHVLVLIMVIVCLIKNIRWPYFLCPLVFMQSIHALGLIILSIATFPKVLNAFANRMTPAFLKLLGKSLIQYFMH